MKKLILMILISLTSAQAQAMAMATSIRGSLARSVQCNAFPNAVSVGLRLVVDDQDNVSFEGNAAFNYASVHFTNCEVTDTQISCSGIWNEEGSRPSPAVLKVIQQDDSTYKGYLINDWGQLITMGCLLSHDPLR